MRKVCSLVFVLFFIFSFSAVAEKNYTSDKVVFLPQEFYVGDLVEMRVMITPEKGAEVKKPESFPDSYWVRIENTVVTKLEDEYELRVFLRPFAPGIRTLPALQFGDVLLRDIKIQTKSVLEQEASAFAPPAEQMLLPGTVYYIALIIGLVFMLPVFFIFFWAKLKNAIYLYIHEQRRKKPYRRLLKVLNELEETVNDKKGNEFYSLLVSELRIYLTARGSIDYSAATAREGARMIASDFGKVSGSGNLINVFKLSDEVRFGGRRVMIRRREEDIEAVRSTADEIEKADAGGVEHVDI